MKIGGSLIYKGARYFVSLSESKVKYEWHVVSTVHRDDLVARVMGQEQKYPELLPSELRSRVIPEGYVLEGMVRTKTSGKTEIFKGKSILSEIIDLLGMALSYGFHPNDIRTDNTSVASKGVIVREFEARDDKLDFAYSKSGSAFTRIYLSYEDVTLDMSEGVQLKIPKGLEYQEIAKKIQGKAPVANIASVDYKSLCEILDMSWYEKDGKILKNYTSAKNIKEFEEKVMTPILLALKEVRALGRKFKLELGLDTETTGLNFYNLSKSNPVRDRLVSIPISWEDHQGVVVFVDMEYFTNVPIDYALGRLRGLIEGESGEVVSGLRTVIEKDNDLAEHPKGAKVVFEDEDYWVYETEAIVFDREDVWLIGHNSPFDARVFLSYDIETYWNDDTLQLAFNLNPRVVKGSNKLKVLTRRLLGAETPELSDLLGKGNETAYRYITDLRVAEIYGCADTDFTRLVRKEELKACTPEFYKNYQKQDIPIMNRLVRAEFDGMPINEEEFLREANILEKDMEKLREFLYSYVGSVVDFRNKHSAFRKKFEAGQISEKEYLEARSKIRTDKNVRYEFKFGGDEMRHVLFDILGYPVVSRTNPSQKHPNGQPAVDKFAIERLMKSELEKPSNLMKSDLKSVDGQTVLLKAETFNKLKYPVAYFLMVYKDLDKDWTSYYKPLKENNLEGRMFKGFSMARIETRRIMSPGQTLKAKNKKNVVAWGPDWYLCDFDQMQVEPRIMTSLSGDVEAIEKFRDPEKDYHTETAARVKAIPPHLLSKKDRKKYKEISIGMPYGLGPEKMCVKINGRVDDKLLYETRKDIGFWEEANKHIVRTLNKFRDEALEVADLPDGLREFIAKTTETDVKVPYGIVKNLKGFYRLFDLTDVVGNRKKEGKVRRPAGNFPIQSMAAELFRIILMRFHRRCVQEGIADKIKWHMLIHDELLFSVHKSIHPFYLYKILYESCNLTFPGHTNYFIGINIGNSWAECKEDENEAPVIFVERIKKRWEQGEFRNDDYVNAEYSFENAKGKYYEKGVKAYVLKHMRQYIKERIGEVVGEIVPDFKTKPINLRYLLDNFTNYMVRSYILMHYPKNRKPESKEDDYVYETHFESWLLDYFGEGVEYISLDGKLRKVYKNLVESIDLGILDEDEEEEVTEVYWTFDDEDIEEVVYQTYSYEDFMDEDEEFLSLYDTSIKGARNVADLAVAQTTRYKYVKKVNGQLFVKVGRIKNINKAKEYLYKMKADKGLMVVLETTLNKERWVTVREDIDMAALEEFAGGLVNAD